MRESDLHGYQVEAVAKIERTPFCGAFLECGLGKSIIGLTTAKHLIDKGIIKKVLVVAPLSVAQNVWENEKNSWEHTKDLRMSVIVGNKEQRKKAMQVDADIYVINRDVLAKEADNLPWCDMLILDESTSFKNPSSQRWKALARKNGKKYRLIDIFKRVLLLTGTPVSENLSGIWAQIWLLDRGKRLFPTISQFRTTWMIPDMFNGYPVWNRFRDGAEAEIRERIKDICFSMRRQDCIELPERQDVIRYTGYTPDAVYKKMKKDGVIVVEEHHIMCADAATRFGKLRQIASGYVYSELGQALFCNGYKENAMKELMESLGNRSVLCFYQFDFERKFLMLDLEFELLDSAEKIQAFNEGRIKRGCAHPASLGYGVNLQKNCDTVIFYSLPLSYEQYSQACDRVHRQGQKKSVLIYHLIGKGTVEEKIYDMLKNRKAILLQDIMQYLKY